MRSALSLAIALLVGAGAASSQDRQWRGVSGAPLPFETATELLDFLRTAEVLEEKDIGAGVNRSKKLLLEKDGVRAHGIYREVDLRKRDVRVGERMYPRFADSYLFECAAFELARLLGIDAVPPVVRRRIRDRDGSLQIWIEDVLDETGESFEPPDPHAWVGQLWEMYFFDNLIYNADRNEGNILVDTDYRLWLIDHTRAFQAMPELLDDRVVRARRSTYERLVKLSEERLREALGVYLEPAELAALLERRERLVARIEDLVAELGEDVVLY